MLIGSSKEYNREYYKKNRDKIRAGRLEYEHEYYRKNRERLIKKSTEWAKGLTGMARELNRRRMQISNLKLKSQRRGIPFDITIEDLDWPTHCPILGSELARGVRHKNSPSVDRIIPELGYVKGNVRVISRLANVMKQDATKEELQSFSTNIMKYIEGEL